MHLTRLELFPERYPTTSRYPFGLPLFQHTRSVPFERPVTFFVGENGTGKSTLLRALARKCAIHIWQYQGGRRCVHNPFEDALDGYLEVEWSSGAMPGAYFASEIFRDFAQLLDEWARSDPHQLDYFGGASLLTQSHGQSLMAYFTHRFRIPGLYLLDEPETALSPRRQLELLRLLEETARAGQAQFVIATHSPMLMACRAAQILSFDGAAIAPLALAETDHYRTWRAFFLDREDPGGST